MGYVVIIYTHTFERSFSQQSSESAANKVSKLPSGTIDFKQINKYYFCQYVHSYNFISCVDVLLS